MLGRRRRSLYPFLFVTDAKCSLIRRLEVYGLQSRRRKETNRPKRMESAGVEVRVPRWLSVRQSGAQRAFPDALLHFRLNFMHCTE